jgi:signal transduction histidine kinase
MAQQLEKRESDLRMTNEELTALNKRYLDLIGMVSHELKGILASTTLNAYSVRDGYLGDINETQRKALDSVTRSLEYFDVTVKNFLNLSRIEKDELSLHPTDFDLKTDIVDPAVEAFIRQAQQRGITIESTIPAGIAGRADSSLLTMIMNNLIANAIKYGAEKERILVSARAEENTLTVEVYNDGRPLTAQETQKLFRRFSRLDTPEGRRVRGTGLGLFLSKQIAERHGGTMWVEPRERGNAFLFRIERYVAERVEAQPMPA